MYTTYSIIIICTFIIFSYATNLQQPSTRLDKYGEVQDTLGSGAEGTIYLFHRREDDSFFAVKEFESDPDEVFTRQRKEEYQIGVSLDHENIIRTLDLVFWDGAWLQVMEYYPETLWDIVYQDEPIDVEEAACIFRQLLHGVSYMHAQGVAHHDLKLTNVMLELNGRAKVIDFGNAYRFQGPLDESIKLRHGPWGAVTYIPPEVYQESTYDPRPVDIWALGIIFCRMVLRDMPWKTFDPSVSDISKDYFGILSDSEFAKHTTSRRSDEVDVIRETVGNLTDLLPWKSRQIISKMLDPSPQARAGWPEVWADKWVRGISCPVD